MCGIVGFITTETARLERDRSKFMRQSLIIDTLRGDDSTGVFAVGHEQLYDDNSAYWYKQLGAGHDFVESAGYWENLFDTKGYRAVVGHNRAATVGGVTTATAHPFQVGPITLVHNGTLTSTYHLPEPMSSIFLPDKQGLDTIKCEVDSHAIAYNLAHHDVPDVIAALEGAFTLVWHDARDDSVNIIRNNQRPLHMALSKQQDTLFFMSEGEMLHMLDRRLKLDLGAIYYPKPGQWLKWLPDSELDSPEVKDCELYQRPTYNRYGNGSAYSNAIGYRYDDEEDYAELYDNGHYSRQMSGTVGNVHSLTADDRVFVGGRKKDVPQVLQEQLLDLDLLVEDRYEFKPKLKDFSGKKLSVIGEVDGKWKAILYSQTEASGNVMDRSWTVRPIGAKITAGGEPLLICKMVSTIWIADRRKGNCPLDDAGRRVLGYHDELDRQKMERTTVRGPFSRQVSPDEYRALVHDGCAVCHRMVHICDAEDVVWSIDGQDFVCWDCDARGDHLFYKETH